MAPTAATPLLNDKERRDEIVRDELKHMLQLSIPVIVTYFLEFSPGLVSMILVGFLESPLTEEYIDAASLAIMFINLTGLSIGFGLATAMDTLCSQAYGGGQSKRMGVYIQTGVIVLSIAFVFVFFANYYCTELLLALKQPPTVAEFAGQFSSYMLPGIPFLYLYELLKKVLQAQNVATPMLVVAVLANLINIGLGYYLVYHTSYGFIGAAIARTVGNISFPLLLMPYLIYNGHFKTFWCGLQIRKAVRGIKQFITLGVSGMLMMCFEWWAFELIALLSGRLPNAVESIGANSVLLNICATTFMFYLGVSVSGNVRIGNALGAGKPDRARIASYLTLVLCNVGAIALATGLLVFRKQIPTLLTNDPGIDALTSQLLYVAAMFQVADATNAAVQGSFRGSGRQILGAKLNFVAYYVVGFSIGVFCAFVLHMGVLGLWIGMTGGLFVVSITGSVFLAYSNWNLMAKEAQDRCGALDTPKRAPGSRDF